MASLKENVGRPYHLFAILNARTFCDYFLQRTGSLITLFFPPYHHHHHHSHPTCTEFWPWASQYTWYCSGELAEVTLCPNFLLGHLYLLLIVYRLIQLLKRWLISSSVRQSTWVDTFEVSELQESGRNHQSSCILAAVVWKSYNFLIPRLCPSPASPAPRFLELFLETFSSRLYFDSLKYPKAFL